MPFNKLSHSHLGEIRPRFKLTTSLTPNECIKVLQNNFALDDSVNGRIEEDHAHFTVPKELQHYWSPELQVSFAIHEAYEGTLVRCLVGPKPTVWTLFAFFYITVGLSTLFGGMFGLTQLQLGHPAPFLWFWAFGALILPTIYISSLIGQKKGRDQMLHLVSFVYHSLAEKGNVERA